MNRVSLLLLTCNFILLLDESTCLEKYHNVTVKPATRQLLEFKLHPSPIGVLTTSAGSPVDIRDTVTLNTDSLSNQFHLDLMTHLDAERIPERLVHAKGVGAYGYFEFTRDVSGFTKADVFNVIGKRTAVFARFSLATQRQGGTDVKRELKGLAVKFYTKHGNLDLNCLNIPVFLNKDPLLFTSLVHAFGKNLKTNLEDNNMRWDFVKPEALNTFLWLQSDYGIPDGYLNWMDGFASHTYEIYNEIEKKLLFQI